MILAMSEVLVIKILFLVVENIVMGGILEDFVFSSFLGATSARLRNHWSLLAVSRVLHLD
jgi:hypothetical protein